MDQILTKVVSVDEAAQAVRDIEKSGKLPESECTLLKLKREAAAQNAWRLLSSCLVFWERIIYNNSKCCFSDDRKAARQEEVMDDRNQGLVPAG